VNNSGFGIEEYFWDADLSGQERMHRLHVLATLKLTHAALSSFVPRNVRAAINVSSVAAFAWFGNVSYGATKAWMKAFGEGVHIDLQASRSEVQIQTLCPGYTHSEFREAMGISDRAKPSSQSWMAAEVVVRISLAGFRRRKHVVVPGWRNKFIAAAVPAIPSWLRFALMSKWARRECDVSAG
jgi:short-subunit dehydrogenase